MQARFWLNFENHKILELTLNQPKSLKALNYPPFDISLSVPNNLKKTKLTTKFDLLLSTAKCQISNNSNENFQNNLTLMKKCLVLKILSMFSAIQNSTKISQYLHFILSED